jgi:hypothetical protein
MKSADQDVSRDLILQLVLSGHIKSKINFLKANILPYQRQD